MVVVCGGKPMIIHSAKYPFRQVSVIFFILFFKSSGAPVYTKLLIFALSGPINCMADILQASPHLKYGVFFTTFIQLCDCARL